MSPETSSDGDYIVIAEFLVKPGKLGSFLQHALDDARASKAHEPGCRQFDVLRASESPNGVVFYEVYSSRAAFDDHLSTPHVARFRAILGEHVESERPVRTFDRL